MIKAERTEQFGNLEINEFTAYKIDRLIEESMLTKISNYISEMGSVFETEGDVRKYVKSEEEARKKREKYLVDNGIDIKKFKEHLKNSDPLNLDWKFLMSSLVDEAKQTTSVTTVLKTVVAVGVIIALNTFIFSIFSAILPPLGALFLTGIMAAPITEELFKRLSVAKNQGFTSNVIFNIAEFSLYVFGSAFASVPILLLLIARIFAVGLHTMLTLIHQKGKILDRYKEDFGLEDFKKDSTFINSSHKIAMLIHGLNNLLGNPLISIAAIVASNIAGSDLPKNKKMQARQHAPFKNFNKK